MKLKNTYAVPGKVPERNRRFFAEGRHYPIVAGVPAGFFLTLGDNGIEIVCKWKECPCLDGGDWRRVTIRMKHELVLGHPVSVWDCPKFADRYTVVYLDTIDKDGGVQYLGMSGAPFHPQGFCQHGEMWAHNVAYEGRGGCFKKRIKFVDLPKDCRKAVEQDLKPTEA